MTDTTKLILGVAIVGVIGVTIAVVASGNNNQQQQSFTPNQQFSGLGPAPGGPGDGADAGVAAVRGGFDAANTFIDRYLSNVDRQRERESRERLAALDAQRDRERDNREPARTTTESPRATATTTKRPGGR